MPLLQIIEYERKIGRLGDISPEAVPEAVLSMLRDVRESVGKLDNSFLDVGLTGVLEAVEAGEYEVDGNVPIRIDLSSAKSAIDAYREYSEGGCQSCVNLGIETIDAQDATSGWYCRVSDPDYNKDKARKDGIGVRYQGFSPKIRKHNKDPCNDWKPRFFPKLRELISGA